MSTLPTDLIVDILSRFSVKTLLKFRCVSKSWCTLIRSPEFVKTHLSVSAKNKDHTHHRLVWTENRDLFTSRDIKQHVLRECSVSSLHNDSVVESLDLNYPLKNPELRVCIVGSVNGLICLDIEDNDLVLWNPTLRVYRKLPDSRLRVSGGSRLDRITSVMYGFGYDEFSDDYKVVGVRCSCTRYPLEVKIYSLKNNSWRTKGDILEVVQLTKPCKFLNGKLHWVNDMNGGFRNYGNIISIDLADERWGKVEQPDYGKKNFSLKLEMLGSDLSVFCNYKTVSRNFMTTSHADVWVMKEYGVKESWTKTYSIKYSPNVFSDFSPFISLTVCMSNKGEILLVPRSTLTAHNPEDEPIRYLKVINFGYCNVANIYIESLVCAPLFGTNKA
ncbi:F-box/kelch-repeat protein At3g23880-like [Solanum stenotomum]|uniref:F-box/kelch-repeat protein At3g23880-like n=1 Tax=Solanum stenotomum TaxID=172797 RepID=UPI0020D0C585|nr:F-box/kelch-repeat protein At3g23880-like [Solanum stenotomum]